MGEGAGDGGKDGFLGGSEEDAKLLEPRTVPDTQQMLNKWLLTQ